MSTTTPAAAEQPTGVGRPEPRGFGVPAAVGVVVAAVVAVFAVVALIDSPRLTAFFAQVVAELRLAFGLLPDPELLHEPFIAENAAILAAVDRDDAKGAAKLLAGYLDRSEGVVLAAFARLEDRRVTPTPRDAPQRRVRTASRRATGA